MAYPVLVVEVGFASAPLATSPTFTQLPAAAVQGLAIRTGKQEPIDAVQPGTLSLQLDNSDRAFDPNNSASPYSPNIKPGKRIRVSAIYNGTGYQLYDGFVDDWPQRYVPGRTSTLTVPATDATKYLRRPIATTPYNQAVAADSPGQWFHLGETTGTRLYEASGLTGVWEGSWSADRSSYKADGLVVGGDGALKLPALPDGTNGLIRTVLFDPFPCSVEFWFKADRPPNADYGDWASLFWGGGLGVQIASTSYNFGYGAGAVRFVITDGTNGLVAETNWGFYNYSICDGQPHHVVCTYNGAQTQAHIWVDGIDRILSQSITLIGGLWWVGRFDVNSYGTWNGEAVLDELALYGGTELTGTQVQAHYAAGSAPWNGDLAGTRIGRVLDFLGWPSTWRDLDAGQQTLGPAVWDRDATYIDYLDLITNTEQGRWGVAWWDNGKVYFRDRSAPFADARSTAVQAVFSDDPAVTGVVRYEAIDLSYSESQLVRRATVKWAGGEVTVTDSTLTSTDLYRSVTVETTLATESEARNLGQYLINKYGTPFIRVRSITVRPTRLANQFNTWQDDAWAACLGLRDGDRVQVKVTPQGVGSQLTLTCFVEGKEHDASNGVENWTTKFYLSPIDTVPTAWLLGSGALDSTTVLSF